MSRRKNHAFTLVELLVVIAIIGILVSLVLAAVQASRVRARQLLCGHNLRQCALAVTSHNGAKGFLPPSRSIHSPTGTVLNWVYPVMPYMEERALHDAIVGNPNAFTGNPGDPLTVPAQIEILMCPGTGSFEVRDFPLSYLVNGGRANRTSDNFDWIENGVFVDKGVSPHAGTLQHSLGTVSEHDGASNTIMMSENVNAQRWTVAPAEQHSQILWFPEDPNSFAGFVGLNRDRKITSTVFDTNIRYARPASNHPGGFQVAMCDGSVRFMNETTNYRVYAVLMTSWGARANDPGNTTFTGTDPSWQSLTDPGYPGTGF
jgi:prepilin-type N-terminal cleavage/methylation domain-containing protein/prepilin-type processing-associated H-X9-DG protein